MPNPGVARVDSRENPVQMRGIFGKGEQTGTDEAGSETSGNGQRGSAETSQTEANTENRYEDFYQRQRQRLASQSLFGANFAPPPFQQFGQQHQQNPYAMAQSNMFEGSGFGSSFGSWGQSSFGTGPSIGGGNSALEKLIEEQRRRHQGQGSE